MSDATLLVEDCTFTNLLTSYYPVLLAWDTETTLRDSTFGANRSTFYAGTIYFSSTTDNEIVVEGATFDGNLANSDRADALYVWGYDSTDALEATVTLTNNTFSGNAPTDSGDRGGAVVVMDADVVTLEGNRFDANYGYGDGGALYFYGNGELDTRENLSCGN